MSQVKVYTKPNCPQCNVVKLALYRAKISYQETPITPDILTHLQEDLNYHGRSMPITVLNDSEAFGPNEIDKLIEKLKTD